MFAEWVRLMQKQLEAASWYDALGDLFMALSSRKGQQAQGQFFTPVHICDLMVMCTETDGKKTGQRINDPTCGSGRLLLAYHVRHLGNYLVAEYRTSRNMSVDLLRKQKEKLRQMQPDKKQLP